MEILKMGEATHGSDFQIMRRNGYPVYLLLLVKTPALFETEDGWKQTPADTAILFRPGQRHSYRAAGESYTDCWMHIQSASPLLFDGFPFGQPIPVRQAKERFYPTAQRRASSAPSPRDSSKCLQPKWKQKAPSFPPSCACGNACSAPPNRTGERTTRHTNWASARDIFTSCTGSTF